MYTTIVLEYATGEVSFLQHEWEENTENIEVILDSLFDVSSIHRMTVPTEAVRIKLYFLHDTLSL